MQHQYIFGPVPSRRLGMSLGIDLVPHKTCSLNCVYCESGETTNLTVTRKEYVPTDAVISEIDCVLSEHPVLDVVTFSGSGEPTLHSGLGRIARHVKEHFPEYRTVLITNGTLFSDPDLRRDVSSIDCIIPSLDAASPELFGAVCRPHPDLDPDTIIQGLVDLRAEYKGEIWLEIFIVPDTNDTPEEIARLRDAVAAIAPDKVQLNTLDRPGTCGWVRPASQESLEAVVAGLEYPNVTICGRALAGRKYTGPQAETAGEILATIARRPCTIDDLSRVLGLHAHEVSKYIGSFMDEGKIRSEEGPRGTFFVPVDQ